MACASFENVVAVSLSYNLESQGLPLRSEGVQCPAIIEHRGAKRETKLYVCDAGT